MTGEPDDTSPVLGTAVNQRRRDRDAAEDHDRLQPYEGQASARLVLDDDAHGVVVEPEHRSLRRDVERVEQLMHRRLPTPAVGRARPACRAGDAAARLPGAGTR